MAKKPMDPNAREALNQLKYEIARDLGITNLQSGNRGNLTSRQNGILGGQLGGAMTKRLIEKAQIELLNNTNKNL